MYNNEVTYDEKWNTDENKKYRKMVYNYIDRGACSGDCPVSWAKEMYFFLKDIDDRFGIAYCTDTFKGYYFQGTPLKNIFVEPFVILFKKYEPPKNEWMLKYEPKTALGFLMKRIRSAKHTFMYGVRTAYFIAVRSFLNKIKNPKVSLGQVKEKYGTVRVYFSTDDRAIDKYIEQKIDELEFKLAQKGAYFPLQNMLNWSTSFSTSYQNHGYEVKPEKDGSFEIIKYPYRQIARDILPKEEYDNLLLAALEEKARKDAAYSDTADSHVELNKHGKESK